MHNELLPQHCGGFSAGTLVGCSCLTINDFAVQAEIVAVKTSIDVDNILWIFYDCLFSINLSFFVDRENFLIMDIYFAALKYQSVEQLKAYDITMFLSK